MALVEHLAPTLEGRASPPLRVLITGPSCAGKTTVGRAQARGAVIHLDQVESVDALLERLDDNAEDCVFEGMPSGSDEGIAVFRDRMDQVMVLDEPFATRLERALERDGPRALGRFLYNEFAWRTYLAGLFATGTNIRHLSAEEASTALADR